MAGLILGIETATALGGVALLSSAGELLGETTLRSRESHAERILPAALRLLETLESTPAAIAAVAVSRGPGSFTGLRAGVAVAKGLAFSLGVPLFGISTLEALAANVAADGAPVCAALNARRGEVFRALFRAGKDGPRRLGEDAAVAAFQLAGELPPGCTVVGDLPPGLFERQLLAGTLLLAPQHLSHPRAAAVAALGRHALGAGRESELATLVPRYVRPPDAQPRDDRR